MNKDIKKRLIVNADDFGLSVEINRGIIECFLAGVLSRISFITNTDLFDSSVELLKKYDINKVGVHLTVVDSVRPLSNGLCTLLDSNGKFYSRYPAIIKKIVFNQVDMQSIEREFRMQIERALNEGFEVTHLDAHQHLHLFPVIREAVIRLALEYKISYIRCPYSEKHDLQAFAVNLLAKKLRHLVRSHGLVTSDYFKCFEFCRIQTKEVFYRVLDMVQYGTTELIVHPGIFNRTTSVHNKLIFDRDKETSILLSEPIREKISNLILDDASV